MCIYIYICVYAYMQKMRVHIYIYVNIYISLFMYIFIYMYVCMYVCVCIHAYLHGRHVLSSRNVFKDFTKALEGRQVLTSFGELTLFHALADIVMDKGTFRIPRTKQKRHGTATLKSRGDCNGGVEMTNFSVTPQLWSFPCSTSYEVFSKFLFPDSDENHSFIRWLIRWLTDSLTDWIIDSLTHWSVEPLIRWFTDSLSLNHWVIDSLLLHRFLDSSIPWFADSLVHWFIETLNHWWFIESLNLRILDPMTHWLLDSVIHCFINSLVHWLTGSFNHWFVDSLTHCFTGSFSRWTIDSLICCFIVSWAHWIHSPVHRFIASLLHCFIHAVVQRFFHVISLASQQPFAPSLMHLTTSTPSGSSSPGFALLALALALAIPLRCFGAIRKMPDNGRHYHHPGELPHQPWSTGYRSRNESAARKGQHQCHLEVLLHAWQFQFLASKKITLLANQGFSFHAYYSLFLLFCLFFLVVLFKLFCCLFLFCLFCCPSNPLSDFTATSHQEEEGCRSFWQQGFWLPGKKRQGQEGKGIKCRKREERVGV